MSAANVVPDYKSENYEMPLDEAIALARQHHIAENYVLAERTYLDVLAAAPEHPTVHHLLGALNFQMGQQDKALHYMEESIRLSPDEPQYRSNYAGVLIAAGRYDEAITYINKVITERPDDIEALNRKAQALWRSDQFADAQQAAESAYKLDPHNIETLQNLGISLAQQKKFKESAEIWKQASDLYPKDSNVWSNYANMLRELKKPQKALIAADNALALNPENAEALNNKACILRNLERHQEALECFNKATDIQPNYPQAHYNKALSYAHLFDYYYAAVASRYAVAFKDDYLDAYNALASSLLELGDLHKAHFAAQKALQLNPDSAESYLNLADVLYLTNRFDDGFAALQKAIKLAPEDHRCYAKLGNIYGRLDERDLAIEAFDKAIALSPDNAMYYASKAFVLHVCNDIDECLIHTDKALALDPTLIIAYVCKAEALITVNRLDEARTTISTAQEIEEDNPHLFFTIASLEKFESEDDPKFQAFFDQLDAARKMGRSCEASVHFAIADVYESLKNYEKAFEHYKLANDIRYEISPYMPEMSILHYNSLKSSYPKQLLQENIKKKIGYPSESPIFIIGMPRSGTTLTEQIISSHPQVYGAGELPDITRVRRKFGEINEETAYEMGKLYVEYSRARIQGGEFKHVTDKMPGNFAQAGLIASILPDAKIIHCRRDPMDTCLSNYKQSFLMGQFWSFNLEELGDEHLRYQDIMEYWHDVMPGRIFDISYEDTVNDLETQARKLIDYIGLEWDDACLMPHKQKRTVLTASKMQVTQPVYKSSVDKWKIYEKQLQPLVRKLRPDEALPVEE